MMNDTKLQLFLNRFLLVNKQRYADNAPMMAVLNNLTLDQVDFSNWRSTQIPDGPIQQTVDMILNNKVTGEDQTYYALDYASPLVSNPTDGTPVAEADLTKKTVTGLYFYNDTNFDPVRIACAVVVRVKNDLYTEGLETLRASCLFELADDEIIKIGDGSSVMVNTKTFADTIKILASELVAFIYDGTYTYDGTLTY